MRLILIAVGAMVLAASCRTSHDAATTATDVRRVEAVAAVAHDSVRVAVELRLDSPEIVVEWPDSPRRRATIRARRAVAAKAVEAQAERRVAASDSLSMQIRANEEHRTDAVGHPWSRLLWLAAGAVIGLSCARILLRR